MSETTRKLADPDVLLPVVEALHRPAETAAHEAGDDERPDGLRVDCERNRTSIDRLRYLISAAEVEAAEEVDAEHAATKVQSLALDLARGSREKMIARSPASSTSSPGNMARPSRHDRLDQRPRRRQVAEPPAREVVGLDCDVENLEAVLFEHRHRFVRVACEADDLLGGDQPRLIATSTPVSSKTSIETLSWTIAIVDWTPCSFAIVAA